MGGKPILNSRGLKPARFGGLSGLPQHHSGAPCSNGIHAFVWPFIELFLLGGEVNQKSRRGNRFDDRYRTFLYKGSLYTPFEIPNRQVRDTKWHLTDHEELYRVIGKEIVKAQRQLRAQNWGKPVNLNCNPYGAAGMCFSKDLFEVFVPRGA